MFGSDGEASSDPKDTRIDHADSKVDDESEEVVCTICAEPIQNYVPKLFYGEPMNPACDNCDDESIDSNNTSEVKVKTDAEDQDISNSKVYSDSEYEYMQDSCSYSHSFNLEIWGLNQYGADDLNFEEPPAAAGN